MKRIHSFDAVHDGQKMFRLLLKAISNPLQRVNIHEYAEKLYGNDKAFLAIAFTMVDNEATFHTFENQILDGNIISLTLSTKASCEEADFIFVADEKNLQRAIEQAKCGTLANPHKSATIIVRIKNTDDISLTMHGAGIDGEISITTNRLVRRAVEMRDEMYFEYPQGLDFLFVDEKDDVFAIPRLVKKGAE